MECIEFRRALLESPTTREAEVLRHRLGCRNCAEWAQKTVAFEQRLKDALAVTVPEGLAERVRLHAAWRRPPRRWSSIAAGALVLVAAGLVAIPFLNRPALAVAVVDHLYHEAELLLPQDGQMDKARVDAVLARVGSRMSGEIGRVTHAGLCSINGRLVAHLVVEGASGPVAVLVMPTHAIPAEVAVGDGSFQGALLPVGQGSIAIIGERGEQLDELAARVRAAVVVEA